MTNEPSRITDNLLNVFNYCFVETVPYAFFKPNSQRDIPVNLVEYSALLEPVNILGRATRYDV